MPRRLDPKMLKAIAPPPWARWPLWARTMVLSASVGLVAGLLASLLYLGIDLFSRVLFFAPLDIGHDLSDTLALTWYLPFLLVLMPAIGGLAVGWLTTRYSPDSAGGGAGHVIRAYHFREGRMDGRVVPFKWLASCLTVGTGGSGGAEGPIAQIGAAAGSWLGQKLNLSASERRLLLTAGMAGAIGAIFRAPLGGALFAAEIYYSRPEIESEAVVPGLMASVAAYALFGIITGTFDPLINGDTAKIVLDFTSFVTLTLIAVGVAIGARAFVDSLNMAKRRMARYYPLWRPAIGGLVTGCIALIVWALTLWLSSGESLALAILGEGYQVLEKSVQAGSVPWLMLLLIIVGKMFSSAFTVGSGGSAGVFAPSMVIGGSIGALAASVLSNLGVEGVPVTAYVLTGMAGFFAAATRCPIASVIIILEVAQGYHLLPALMWVAPIGYLLGPRSGLFSAQLPSSADSPAHRGELSAAALRRYKVEEVMSRRSTVTFEPDESLARIRHRVAVTRQEFFPVLNEKETYQGGFYWGALEGNLDDIESAGQLAATNHPTVEPGATLDVALRLLNEQKLEEMPVVDKKGRFTGLVNRRQILGKAVEA